MYNTVLVTVLALFAGLPSVTAEPLRSEAKVYFSSVEELMSRLGPLLGELDICTSGRTEDDRFFLVINARADELEAVQASGLLVEITWRDIRDKFAAMTGRNPDDGSFRDFGYFFNYWEMRDTLYRLCALHPAITRLDSSMRSFQNRALYCVKISDNPQVDENEPAIFINGATHAREPLGTHTCIAFASLLCQLYGIDSSITWLVDNREIFLVPVMNPDGYVYNSDSGGATANWRKNRNNTSPRTGPGVDLNRNYGYKWAYDNSGSSGTPSSETYRGPSRFSEPETQAIRDFMANHKFRTCMDYHTYGRYNMYAWGYANATIPDQTVLREITDTLAANNHYTHNGPVYTTIYPANGVSVDWEYADTLLNGVRKFITYAFTCELGINDFWYGASDPTYVDNEVALNIPNLHYLTRVSGVFFNPDGVVVNDTAAGNANGQLDPGETANLWFKIKNRAIHPLDTAKAITAVLLTSDTMVRVITPTVSFPVCPRRSTVHNGTDQFTVVCSPNATPGTIVNLRLELTYVNDGVTIMQPVNFRIAVGSASGVAGQKPDFSLSAPSLTASPNPAQHAIVINTVVPWSASGARLNIYNQAGLLVKVFPIPTGAASFIWNGLDARNRRVQSGIYFAELVVNDFSAWTKLTLLD